jgi:hypothetical protein
MKVLRVTVGAVKKSARKQVPVEASRLSTARRGLEDAGKESSGWR